jgi:hypothetical protein
MEQAAGQQWKQLSLPVGHKARRLRLELQYAEKFNNPTQSSDSPLKLRWEEVYIENLDASRSLGLYKSKQVLVEWRDLDSDRNAVQPQARLVANLEMLCLLLHESTPRPPEFRSLICVGYLLREAPTRFAFVFDVDSLPSPSHPLTRTPSSLLDILSDESRSRARPTQESRFHLATQLARSLVYLHGTGWLHKGIRSQNILLLGPGDTESSPSISSLIRDPYLVGHGYARLSRNVAGSEPVDSDSVNAQYRHPDTVGEPRATFVKKYDAYSLGTVLVEVAYWKPLAKILGSRRTPAECRRKLMDLVANGDIAHWMGSIYSSVVGVLLACEWSQDDLELELYDNAVEKLETCLV